MSETTEQELVLKISNYVWGDDTPLTILSEEDLLNSDIDLEYVQMAIDFTIAELARFFTNKEGLSDEKDSTGN
jgi:hypothetical protein